jgi:hypothetical protein
MTRYEIFLFSLVIGLEILLCVLVYYRKLYRRLPVFAAYATTMLVCSAALAGIFTHFGFRSDPSVIASWYAIAVTSLARSAAVAELCRESLKAYQGIWALTWRLLTAMTAIFFLHAAIDARGLPNWFTASSMTMERDVEIASAAILVAVFLVGKYYHLSIDPVQKLLVFGIILFCIVEFVNNSIGRDVLTHNGTVWTIARPLMERATRAWNTVQAVAADTSIGIWCFALRKPLPERVESPALLPAETYGELSPAINLRLRALNTRLMDLLRP